MAMTPARTPIVITHDGALQFTAQVRSHRIVVDQPHRGGGNDAGPSPIELLGVSLGTCVAFYVRQFCHARGLLHEGLRVEVEQRTAANPHRIGEFHVRVVLPRGLPIEYATMIECVVASCPAHNTLVHGADVTASIEIAASPAPAV
jgi:putative redox protein